MEGRAASCWEGQLQGRGREASWGGWRASGRPGGAQASGQPGVAPAPWPVRAWRHLLSRPLGRAPGGRSLPGPVLTAWLRGGAVAQSARRRSLGVQGAGALASAAPADLGCTHPQAPVNTFPRGVWGSKLRRSGRRAPPGVQAGEGREALPRRGGALAQSPRPTSQPGPWGLSHCSPWPDDPLPGTGPASPGAGLALFIMPWTPDLAGVGWQREELVGAFLGSLPCWVIRDGLFSGVSPCLGWAGS